MSTTKRRAVTRRAFGQRLTRPGLRSIGVGLASAVTAALLMAGGAQAATAPVGLGSAAPFSVLAGSTVTNTGPTTMFGDLGLDPGSSITGAPHALGSTHIDDGVALSAKNALTVSYTDAAGRPATKLASADLSGQSFTPGVYDASSALLFSAGNVTLNAQGNPNAVFIFQVGSSLTTGSATHVLLINGAQPCNVFWQIGASATLGTNSTFAGTVMALTTITANTGVTLNGRLLARNGAVNLDTNTITTSACAAGSSTTGTTTTGGTTGTGSTGTGSTGTPIGSQNTTKSPAAKARAKRIAARKARAKRLAKARKARARRLARERARLRTEAHSPHTSRSFTG